MPRSQRGALTRERILEATARAFDRSGYLGLNLKEVVEDLGLTKGALYYFFPTKESLAAEIVRRHVSAFEPIVSAALAEKSDMIDALIEIGQQMARRYETDSFTRAGTRLLSERALISTELPEPFVDWIERVTGLLRTGQQQGQVRADVDPEETAQMVVSFLHGAQTLSDQFSDRQDLSVRL
ncbi:MAG: ScbR family autoregulator-binding transcription factor, partial [Actinomycetota bacterium]